jgi:hypothetical protein
LSSGKVNKDPHLLQALVKLVTVLVSNSLST